MTVFIRTHVVVELLKVCMLLFGGCTTDLGLCDRHERNGKYLFFVLTFAGDAFWANTHIISWLVASVITVPSTSLELDATQ